MLVAIIALTLRQTLLDFSLRAWRSTPEVRIEDAYKWIFHATQGGEHAVRDEGHARTWLEREWKSLGPPLPKEPAVVALSPDGKVIRVNLRPYRAMAGNPDLLLAAFLRSAESFRPDKKRFAAEWLALGRALRRAPVGRLSWHEWCRLDRQTKPLSYPAIDHSAAYERAYRPAYRVLLRDHW